MNAVSRPQDKTWVQLNVGYYLFALIFLIFDVELVFLYPWAVVAKKVGWMAFIESLFSLQYYSPAFYMPIKKVL
ncbi:NAD(P)H-quinone oxidoreductase subunit 3, chloroplastic [Filimonas sp.]|nr:NAD(P)H-quinone oxidoreductase subunit 3, chloroplastic [Filimonas sp.]